MGGERFVLARRSIPRLRRALGAIAPAPLAGAGGAIDASGPAGTDEDFFAFVEEWIAFCGPFPPEMLAAAAGRRGLSAEELLVIGLWL